MYRWLISRMRQIVRAIVMKAAYWTAIGAVLIPIGVAVLLGEPSMRTLAFWLMLAGFASFIAGWGYTIREDHRNTVRERKEKQHRLIEGRQRRRESRAYLLVLSEMARRQGVSMVKVARKLQRWADDEKEDGEDESDDE